MRSVIRPLLISLFIILIWNYYATGQSHVGAIVEKFDGKVLLKQNGKQLELNSKTDVARRLYAGDSVHCELNARLTLRIGGRTTELDDKSGWFVIPRSTTQADPRQQAIDEYGRIGGRSRGPISNSILNSPADDSMATPDFFFISWAPVERRCRISFTLEGPGGKRLWTDSGIEGAAGVLESDAAREALVNYRREFGGGEFRLKLIDSCGHSDQSNFGMLSTVQEQKLKTALALWDQEENELFARLGRASVFIQARMPPQAAKEYEAALALAPDSLDLIESTGGAERLTGNVRRARELEKRLIKVQASRH